MQELGHNERYISREVDLYEVQNWLLKQSVWITYSDSNSILKRVYPMTESKLSTALLNPCYMSKTWQARLVVSATLFNYAIYYKSKKCQIIKGLEVIKRYTYKLLYILIL
jgi:hypothetical protein